MFDFEQARQNMVECQIRTVRVTDAAVIEALRSVPREAFLPAHLKSIAYVDDDLRLNQDRFMMEPMVMARLLQAAEIGAGDTALAIGCTRGYAVALLARMAETVVGVESDPDFVAASDAALSALGVDNAAVIEGDLAQGYPRQAPYDVILIEGRCAEVPQNIVDQLAEGGRLIGVIDDHGVGKAVLMRRSGGAVGTRVLFDAQVPALKAFGRAPEFQF
jgi:protein-L-isoaspartate(D-aspartate) O-methyltransferase